MKDKIDLLVDKVMKKMGCKPNKPAKWIENVYRTSMGFKHIDGYICSKCGKHSYSKAEKCLGCGSIMPK